MYLFVNLCQCPFQRQRPGFQGGMLSLTFPPSAKEPELAAELMAAEVM